MTMPLFSSLSWAGSCQCPVIQCEPCQRLLRLGTEEISCGPDRGKAECDKVVCENVDNFFQCLAGEKPLYVPPQNPLVRITEPRDPVEVKPIDFQKLANEEPAPLTFEETELPLVKNSKVEVRELASVMTQQAPKSQSPLYRLENKDRVRMSLNKERVKKVAQWKGKALLHSEDAALIHVTGDNSRFTLRLSPQTKLEMQADNEVLWLNLISGKALVQIKVSSIPHVHEAGLWRFVKREGSYQLQHKSEEFSIENKERSAYLRRNELIAKAEEILPHKTLLFDKTKNLVAMETNTKSSQPSKYEMPGGRTSQRGLAQFLEPLCQQPQAEYQQCAWKCFGQSTSAKKCGQNPQSRCLRFTCTADGLWKLPTLSTFSECSTKEVRVGACQ